MSTIRRTTNGFVQSLTDLTTEDFNPLSSQVSNSGSTDSESYFSWQNWLIIILVLALFGINIFTYLGQGTQALSNIFSPILKIFGYQTLEATKQTIDVSAVGTKKGVDVVSNTATGAIDIVQPNVNVGANQKKVVKGKEAPINAEMITQSEDEDIDGLDKALRDASRSSNVSPDDAQSSIQSIGKSGWCYVGDDKNVRVCSKIGVNDQCLSGDIFPSQDICMNPNLRV